MKNAKILLAGPGTGKTTKIKEILRNHSHPSKILIVSFTNATINDLLTDFKKANLPVKENSCMTLHKYALKINHRKTQTILNDVETTMLLTYSKWLKLTESPR